MAKTLDAAGVKRLIQEIKGANKNLNTAIPISTENTTESMAQNVKNIADYVEKAKAAGIANVDGMAVTCLIDDGYSGVGSIGCLPGNIEISICGIITYDGTPLENPTFFAIDPDGTYRQNNVLIEHSKDIVTSDMLVEGARKPIILTPSTTEVDEETYQKLLSDNVDVVYKTGDGEFCVLTYKIDADTTWDFYFSCFSVEGETEGDVYIYAYRVSIVKNAPHTCTISMLKELQSLDDIITAYNFIKKPTLTPVLQEIDLTGTDAERKAKLDQFETDWKALTGASDLTGARFVGRVDDVNQRIFKGLLSFNSARDFYSGIAVRSDDSYEHLSISVTTEGYLEITPLFSHLEAVTIYTDNTPEHMQANLDNIAAYEANLQALGVDTVGISIKAPIIPIYTDDSENHGFIQRNDTGLNDWTGICTAKDWLDQINIDIDSGKATVHRVALYKDVVDKILNAKSLEAIAIKTDNSTANVAAIKAYVDNLKALGVDTTKGYIIPITDGTYQGILMSLDSRNKRYRGQLYKDDEHYCPLYIQEDGAIHVSDIFISYTSNLTTKSEQVVGAINEVNALAKGYSTIFTPIELTTETAQNKTAIDARVAAFTAQGISLTNGCCIPVTYKGVYAGNISLINGDWYGLLVKNTNNPADNINIKLSADGTVTEGNSAQ